MVLFYTTVINRAVVILLSMCTLAGGVGIAIIQVASIGEIGTVSASTLVLSAFIPALFAGAWWWRRR